MEHDECELQKLKRAIDEARNDISVINKTRAYRDKDGSYWDGFMSACNIYERHLVWDGRV